MFEHWYIEFDIYENFSVAKEYNIIFNLGTLLYKLTT